MVNKSELIFCDSHIHIADIQDWKPVNHSFVCSCAHSKTEFIIVEKAAAFFNDIVVPSFGIHPQNIDLCMIEYLEKLLVENRIAAIGEVGFDLFSSDFAMNFERQQQVWNIQLDLALKYNKPLVIHCRKALDKIFPYAKKLSKLPAVLFHSFSGSPQEAKAFLNRGINAWFSFSKQILKGNKRAILCVTQLPLENLLAETDAPFQTLAGEVFTKPEDIVCVYKKIAELRNESLSVICNQLEINFKHLFKNEF